MTPILVYSITSRARYAALSMPWQRVDNAGMSHAGAWRNELRAGWLVLATATFGCGTGASSLLFYSFGLFVVPLEAAFGWTRGEVSSALFYGSFGLVCAAPLLGFLIDRFGARVLALCAIPLLAGMLYSLSWFDRGLYSFYAFLFVTTFVGSGTTPILYTRAVAGNFDAMRGLALGITLAGPGTAAIVLPPFMEQILTDHGWRTGFMVLALLALAPWPLVLMWLREQGGTLITHAAASTGMDRLEAMSSRIYWTVAIGFTCAAVGGSAVVVHLVPMLTDVGVSRADAAKVASVVGIGVILGRVCIGWVIDHLFAPNVAAAIFVITGVGCAILAVAGPEMAPFAAFLVGFALGAEVDLMAFLTARYFGLRNYGFLYATVYACFWSGVALGPAIAGKLFDHYGNYDLALCAVIALFALSTAAAVSLPRFPLAARAG